MNIKEFIDKFTINPSKDIDPNFTLTKKLNIDVISNSKGCYNCGDSINQKRLESCSWTAVQYCWKCNHLNVIYFSDRMGGNHEDVVMCYTDKQ